MIGFVACGLLGGIAEVPAKSGLPHGIWRVDDAGTRLFGGLTTTGHPLVAEPMA